MKNKKGLLALIGVAAGAFAFWKYKNMTPEEKANLKNRVNNAGQKLKETAHSVEDSVKEKYDTLKKSATEEMENLRR